MHARTLLLNKFNAAATSRTPALKTAHSKIDHCTAKLHARNAQLQWFIKNVRKGGFEYWNNKYGMKKGTEQNCFSKDLNFKHKKSAANSKTNCYSLPKFISIKGSKTIH